MNRTPVARLFFLAFSLLIAVIPTGCRVIDSEEETEEELFAYASATCAPWDGPALDLVLTAQEQSCANLESVTYGDGPSLDFTRLVIYGINEPESGRNWTIDSDDDGSSAATTAGTGQSCPGNQQPCVLIDRATVSFTEEGENDFSVSATILFQDGSQETLRHKVRICPRPEGSFCG